MDVARVNRVFGRSGLIGGTVTRILRFRAKDDTDIHIESEDEQEECVKEVFSNYLLLRNIMKYSYFKDLKSFRQINRLWKQEATKILLNNFGIHPIQIDQSMVYTYYDPRQRGTRSVLKLKKFTSFVQNSEQFPWNTFSFPYAPKLLRKSEYQIFLNAHGSIIKSLELAYNFLSQTNVDSIAKFLMEHLPNLEILIAAHNPEAKSNPRYLYSGASESLQFKHLRKLKFRYNVSRPFLETILKSAPNLTTILWDVDSGENHCENLKKVVELNAVQYLESLRLYFCNANIELYESVLKQQLRFNRISVNFDEPLSMKYFSRVGQILTKCLQQVKNTQRYFWATVPLGNIPRLKIPVLSKLKEIDFLLLNESSESVCSKPNIRAFPSDASFSKTFPNLQKVRLYINKALAPLIPNDFFNSGNGVIPLLSVEHLYLSCPTGLATLWVAFFCQLFPNLKCSSMKTLSDFDSAAEYIWKLSSLEELELQIKIDVHKKTFLKIDSSFTGFPAETVRNFYGKLSTEEGMKSDPKIDALRIKPSIVDLKLLKKLSISLIERKCFRLDKHDILEDNRRLSFVSGLSGCSYIVGPELNVILSVVSDKYGFQMCPKLGSHVTVRFQNKYGRTYS